MITLREFILIAITTLTWNIIIEIYISRFTKTGRNRNEIEILRRENAGLKTKLDWYKRRYNGLLRRQNEMKERKEDDDEPETAVYESAGARYISGLHD